MTGSPLRRLQEPVLGDRAGITGATAMLADVIFGSAAVDGTIS